MADSLPIEDFFRKPERVQVSIAPDGRHLAWMAPFERRLNVFVREVATGKERRLTSESERDIAGYLWAGRDQIVFAKDRGGDENFRLFGVGVAGGEAVDLTPFDGVKCLLVDDLEDHEGEILFQMNRRDPERFDVYRIDVQTGDMAMVARNPGNVSQWMTDFDGTVRLGVTTDGVNTSILTRDTEDDPWRLVATYDFMESVTPLQFSFDGTSAIVSSNVGRDKAAIYTYDLATGEPGDLIFEHPDVDVARVLSSRRRRVLTGVAFEVDRPERVFFDDQRAKLQAFVDERLPDTINDLVSHTRDETRYVVRTWNERTRGAYHLVDTAAQTLTHLFDVSPWLCGAAMAPVTPVRIPARDGLSLPGYLTLPAGASQGARPLVVNPHGGPWARDGWGFNPEVQMLANRGFAVLQVNFRGSTGYGRAFVEASFGQWGLAMQDDVTDAVRWAIEQGVADPERVGIYGGSYGGYAALSGLTKTPDLYACGVSYVGVSNLFTWMAAIPPYWKPYLEMMHRMVGHPARDEDRMRDTSPLFHADRIAVPLFVAQGANDPRVRKEESDQIVEALRARGVQVEYMVKENEGHGFQNEENQMAFYRAMAAFFQQHMLGVPA